MSQLAQKHGRIPLTERRFLSIQKKNKINLGGAHPISVPPQVMLYKDQRRQKLAALNTGQEALESGKRKTEMGGVCPNPIDRQTLSVRNTPCMRVWSFRAVHCSDRRKIYI